MDGWVERWVDGMSFFVSVFDEMVFIIIRMISTGWNQSASENQTGCHWLFRMNWLGGL